MSLDTGIAPPIVPPVVVPPVEPVVVPPVADDSNPLRAVREQLNTEKQARLAAESKLQEMERANLSEVERLRVEAEEGKTAKAELADAKAAAEAAFQDQVDSLPEQYRAVAEAGCAGKSHTDKMAFLKTLRGTLPVSVQAAGTVTTAAGATLNGTVPQIKIDPRNPFGSYASEVGFKSADLSSLVAKP